MSSGYDSDYHCIIGVGSDLDGIWNTLENGRMDWLGAVTAAHPLKVILKEALNKDKNKTERDEVDIKMVEVQRCWTRVKIDAK